MTVHRGSPAHRLCYVCVRVCVCVPQAHYPQILLAAASMEFLGAVLFASDIRFGAWLLVRHTRAPSHANIASMTLPCPALWSSVHPTCNPLLSHASYQASCYACVVPTQPALFQHNILFCSHRAPASLSLSREPYPALYSMLILPLRIVHCFWLIIALVSQFYR